MNVREVLDRCAATPRWAVGMCGQFCAAMFGYGFSGYVDAVAQWRAVPSALKVPDRSDAPAGTLLFWGGGSQGHGHVAVSVGDGTCWSIDICGAGTVCRADVGTIASQWGLPFLGWSVPYFQGEQWSPPMIYGVDVSAYQAVQFPLTTPGDGKPVSFAFIKSTQGTSYINPRLAGQTAWSRSKGLVTGFYHFLEKGNVQAQADYFLANTPEQAGDILVCDWETNPATSTYATGAQKDQWIRAVQAARPGLRVLLYCNTSFWKNIDTTSFAGDGLWIATAGYPAGSPPIQAAWALHQYSTSGDIDHDVAQFGTRAEMAAWAGGEDVALTQADIDAVALATVNKLIAGGGVLESTDVARIFQTDGILKSPDDAVDHDTNPFWAFASYVTDTGARVRAATGTLDAILAQARTNGSGISGLGQSLAVANTKLDAIQATLDSIDFSSLPADVAAKLDGLRFVLQEGTAS